MSLPVVAVVAAGAMGAAVGRRLTTAGLTVLTNLDGRSPATRARAEEAGLKDASFAEIASKADWVLSILPPSEAYRFAERFRDAHGSAAPSRPLGFADCNAVNPTTVKRIAELFKGTSVTFIDAGIIGGPPKGEYNPVFYASTGPESKQALQEFAALTKYGLNVKTLDGEGAGVGDASALKMSYAGMTKGVTGLTTTMLLAAHAASPATSHALLEELADSQPILLHRIINGTPGMLPKAYRWVGEMEEISAFVEDGLGGSSSRSSAEPPAVDGEGHIHFGLARLYERIASALKDSEGGEDQREVKVLKEVVEDAKRVAQARK